MRDAPADLFGHERLARPIFGGDTLALAPWAQHELWDRAATVWQWGKPGPRGVGAQARLSVAQCTGGLWWSKYRYDLWGAAWGECGGGSPFIHPDRERAASIARTAADLLLSLSRCHKPTPKRARTLEREWRPALEALAKRVAHA